MNSLKVSDYKALQFLLTEEIYHINGEEISLNEKSETQTAPPVVIEKETVAAPETVSVAPSAANQATEAPKQEDIYFEYLGENNKYTLILVNEPAHKHIDAKELETLTNILKGKKQDIKDVAIVNLHKYPEARFSQLRKFFVCNSLVLFGIDPAAIQIEGLGLNKIADFQGSKVLATYKISEMLADVNKKRAFWEEMKKL